MKYRTREEWRKAPAREPIKRYSRRLLDRGVIDAARLEELDAEAGTLASDAATFAEDSPEPTVESRFTHVLNATCPNG